MVERVCMGLLRRCGAAAWGGVWWLTAAGVGGGLDELQDAGCWLPCKHPTTTVEACKCAAQRAQRPAPLARPPKRSVASTQRRLTIVKLPYFWIVKVRHARLALQHPQHQYRRWGTTEWSDGAARGTAQVPPRGGRTSWPASGLRPGERQVPGKPPKAAWFMRGEGSAHTQLAT